MDAIPPGTDLSKIPMKANPSGAPPNFDHGPNLINAVQGVGISLAVVTTILLVIRLWIYLKLNRRPLLDDVFLLIAYVMALSYTVQASTLGRLCRHSWDTPLSEINEDYIKKLFATSIVYGPMFFFAKAAILILYYRTFKPAAWMRRSCWIVGIILFGAYWQTVPQNFIYCMPHNGKPWDFAVLSNCSHLKIPGLVHGASNVAADVVLVLLPVPIVAKLHVPLGKKIAISAIFATGLFALTCSVLAIYYRVEISYGSDPNWSNAQAWVVIQAEIYAAICVACAPSLAKFWKLDFKSTRLHATLQLLLHSIRSSKQDSYPSLRGTRAGQPFSESVSALQKQSGEVDMAGFSFSSVHAGERGYEMQNHEDSGVYHQVTVDITSQAYNRNAA